MKEGKAILRQRFLAEADIDLHEPKPEDWKQYAEWLENLVFEKLNSELAKSNELLRYRIHEAMVSLEEGLSHS